MTGADDVAKEKLAKWITFASVALIFHVFATSIARADVVRICDEEKGWPPFVYNPITKGKPDTNRVEGATVELLDAIFKEIGLKHSLELLPWKRCTDEVENFAKNRRYEAFSNGSYSKERAELYHVSLPIYSLDRGVFYSTTKFPDGIVINKPEDIQNYLVCGVIGYTYELWGLNEENITSLVKTSAQALKMVSRGRCEAYPSSLMPIYGALAIGESIIPDGVSVKVIDSIPARTFHIFISRDSDRAKFLLKEINSAIRKLRDNGQYEEIFNRYYKKVGLTFKKPEM